MADLYSATSSSLSSPASGGFAVAASDSADLAQITRALYIGVGGNLSVEMAWGGVVTFNNLPNGAMLPIRAKRVLLASTATAIVGLY